MDRIFRKRQLDTDKNPKINIGTIRWSSDEKKRLDDLQKNTKETKVLNFFNGLSSEWRMRAFLKFSSTEAAKCMGLKPDEQDKMLWHRLHKWIEFNKIKAMSNGMFRELEKFLGNKNAIRVFCAISEEERKNFIEMERDDREEYIDKKLKEMDREKARKEDEARMRELMKNSPATQHQNRPLFKKEVKPEKITNEKEKKTISLLNAIRQKNIKSNQERASIDIEECIRIYKIKNANGRTEEAKLDMIYTAMYRRRAEEYGLDITGKGDEKIMLMVEIEKYRRKAEEYRLNITGKGDEDIIRMVEIEKQRRRAEEYGLNISSETGYEDIIKMISDERDIRKGSSWNITIEAIKMALIEKMPEDEIKTMKAEKIAAMAKEEASRIQRYLKAVNTVKKEKIGSEKKLEKINVIKERYSTSIQIHMRVQEIKADLLLDELRNKAIKRAFREISRNEIKKKTNEEIENMEAEAIKLIKVMEGEMEKIRVSNLGLSEKKRNKDEIKAKYSLSIQILNYAQKIILTVDTKNDKVVQPSPSPERVAHDIESVPIEIETRSILRQEQGRRKRVNLLDSKNAESGRILYYNYDGVKNITYREDIENRKEKEETEWVAKAEWIVEGGKILEAYLIEDSKYKNLKAEDYTKEVENQLKEQDAKFRNYIEMNMTFNRIEDIHGFFFTKIDESHTKITWDNRKPKTPREHIEALLHLKERTERRNWLNMTGNRIILLYKKERKVLAKCLAEMVYRLGFIELALPDQQAWENSYYHQMRTRPRIEAIIKLYMQSKLGDDKWDKKPAIFTSRTLSWSWNSPGASQSEPVSNPRIRRHSTIMGGSS